MADFPISLPPGVYRSGTIEQSAGRFYDQDLTRWGPDGSLQPVGGWLQVSEGTVSGKARQMHIWTDNGGAAKTVIGTHTGLFYMSRPGNLFDITPAGFSTGRADSDSQGGFGNGLFGRGPFGTGRPFSLDPHDVSVWQFDNFGQVLIGVMADDGKVYLWDLNTSDVATQVPNSPTGRAIVVTAERILMVGGVNGNPRSIAWSDQEDYTLWTDSTTNYAGSWDLQTAGKIMAMKRVRGGVLILTTADVHLASFVGQPLVYGFEQKGGAGTGIVAQGAVATMDGEAVPANAVWMGQEAFFAYNGYVQTLDCDVAGEVFSNINRSQISKVTAWHNADNGEVWWFYPSSGSLENDRYVFWDYRKNIWGIGRSGIRLSGHERGALRNPLAVDVDGKVFKHEYGLAYDGNEPYAETGPFKIGQGDNVIHVLKVYPDEKTLGDVDITFYTRFRPMGEETARGAYVLAQETNVRFTAREFRARFTGARQTAWRVGNFILNGVQGGRR